MPRKILYLSPNATGGGAETFLLHAARFHDRSRYEPEFWFFRDGPLVSEIRERGCPARVGSAVKLSRPWTVARAQAELLRYLRSSGIRIVHSTLAYGHLASCLPIRLAGAREAWFHHGPLDDLISRPAELLPAHRILVPSEHVRKELAARIRPAWRDRISIVNPSVDLEAADSAVQAAPSIREKLGFGRADLVVAIAGRFRREKGIHFALDLLERLAPEHPRLKALLIGDSTDGKDGSYVQALRERARSLGDRVRVTGWVPSALPYFAASDIVISGSVVVETFSTVAVEAKALGKAFVGPDRGGPLEIVDPGRTGLLYSWNDVDSLVDQVRALLADPAFRQRLGTAARADAETRHSAEAMIRKVEQAYDSLV